MKVASLALFIAAAMAQLTINTPASTVQCEPVLVSWSGGTAPYYISVHPGSSPDATALENFPTQNGTSYTWNCDIAQGTSIGFTIRDSTGSTAQTAPFSVQGGGPSTCLSGSSSGGSGGSSTSGGSSSTPGSSSGSSTGSSSSPSPTTSTTGAGSMNVVNLGAVGAFGAAVAALLL